MPGCAEFMILLVASIFKSHLYLYHPETERECHVGSFSRAVPAKSQPQAKRLSENDDAELNQALGLIGQARALDEKTSNLIWLAENESCSDCALKTYA